MNQELSRRNFTHALARIGAACALTNIASPAIATSCPIGWQPSAAAPVFYGYRDYMAPIGSRSAAVPCRVFYPSLDGSPHEAPFLSGCRKYPLIMFVHGQCDEPDHYKKWSALCAQLARSGYIVAVPKWPANYPWEADYLMLARLRRWMFSEPAGLEPETGRVWAGQIAFRTGIAGHSYGALLAARLFSLSAYVSIDGVWDEWPSTPAAPILAMTIPKLFLYGLRGAGVVPSLWPRIPAIKHAIEFVGAQHWDYLRASTSTCERDQGRGPCASVEKDSLESIVWFFAKYLPPETWGHLVTLIPNSLMPSAMTLTREQRFFAGAHPVSRAVNATRAASCRMNMMWTAARGETGTLTRP